MAKLEKGSKEYREAKEKGREALDRLVYEGDRSAFPLRDSTVGHVEGPPGTWNTSGVEVPMNAASVRDVRPETGDTVSLEGLKELGVPIRDESDFTKERPAPAAEPARVETQDRTMQIPAAREAVESESSDTKAGKKKAAKEGKTNKKK